MHRGPLTVTWAGSRLEAPAASFIPSTHSRIPRLVHGPSPRHLSYLFHPLLLPLLPLMKAVPWSGPPPLHSGDSVTAVPLGRISSSLLVEVSSCISLLPEDAVCPFLQLLTTSFLTLLSVWYSLPSTFSIYLPTCLDCELVGAGSERGLITSLSGSLLLFPFLKDHLIILAPLPAKSCAGDRFRGEPGVSALPSRSSHPLVYGWWGVVVVGNYYRRR